MSTAIESRESADVSVLAGLLKEYRDHLRGSLGALHWYVLNSPLADGKASAEKRREWEKKWQIEGPQIRHFVAALERFVRQVSQFVDHSQIDEFQRIELELRLADIEAMLKSAHASFSQLP